MTTFESSSSSLSKGQEILARLRREIVAGEIRPGAQLPLRTQIEQRFDASSVTVQRALDQLMREGFVWSSRGRGTFVADHPPHLSHYALLFYSDPSRTDWGQFAKGLAAQAHAIDRQGERKITCYYGLVSRDGNKDYQDLLRKIQNGQLAGLIFTTPSKPVFFGTPLADHPGVARVWIATQGEAMASTVAPDFSPSFFERAVEYLAQRGRRAPAVLYKSSTERHNIYRDLCTAAFARHGMRHKTQWSQFVDVFDPEAAMYAVHAIMDRANPDPPDSLIIADDTMLESATAGLIAAGVRVPTDVDVVAHCNFPWLAKAVVPVKRLGFDLREILQTCIGSIDRQRRGLETHPCHVAIPARFDHELTQVTTSAPPVAAHG